MRLRRHLKVANGSSYPLKTTNAPLCEVTQSRLEMAKWSATLLFTERSAVSKRAFRNFAVRKYRCKPQQVTFDDKGALRRIRGAILSYSDDPYLNGQTSLTQIEIMHQWSTWAELVTVLIHEAMHNWCRVRGKFMHMENEHWCMGRLGEPNER